jgi:DUF1680 family protein
MERIRFMIGKHNNNRSVIKIAAFAMFLLLISINTHAQQNLYSNEFALGDVRLLEGPFQHARDLNIKTILKYDTDRMLAGYRKEAGLPAKALSYPNWEGLDGHVGGHYLSALAMNYAATNNTLCKQRMDYMIAELKACEQANEINNAEWGKGYIGAVPNSKIIWSSFKRGDFASFKAAWVPWYNVHKMYAGLRDAWIYAGNKEAKNLFLKFCDWGINITSNLNDEQMQSILEIEQGGMNEIFADAYQITRNEKYLKAAKRFSHKSLLNAMTAQNDNLDNKHANTQVPKAVGFERIAEITKDDAYAKAGSFFWETVTTHRSLAFGGNSRREFFPSKTSCIDFVNDVEGPESCNSYNMLKLTEDLFRVNALAKYADYYERTLYNHILSTQHPEHGGYVYFTPVRPRHYRVYSSPNQGMWCCVGSGMENHSKYEQFIYTRSGDTLYVNLFVASELNWKAKKIKIKQQTVFPNEEKTKLTITEGSSRFTLNVRYPSWVPDGDLKILVNGKIVTYKNHPSSYVAINRVWKKGDVVNVILPMHNTLENLPNLPNYLAIMHGPILLAARTGTEDLKGLVAGDSRWGHIASGKKMPIDKAPILIEDNIADLPGKLEPVMGVPLTFTATAIKMVNPINAVFEPFYKIHDARYMMYWMTLSNSDYQTYLDSVKVVEKQKEDLGKRTIDFIAPGEQQPEADHQIEKLNSNTGNYLDEFWRDARNGGYFSYNLSTGKETGVSLIVRYWGNERGNRKFDIYIDDQMLVSESISERWNLQKFYEVEYQIPDSMTKNKDHVRVKFQAQPGNIAGAVYYLRLARK